MNPGVLKRFVFYMFVLTFVFFSAWMVFSSQFASRQPGDLETELGTQRLEDGLYEAAMEYYDKALAKSPDHRGALMGRALVYIRTEQYDAALAELDYLIGFLENGLEPDDTTGRGVLAAAYANRGIVFDRQGEYEKALDSYVSSLKVDDKVVSGPGLVHKILYGSDDVSTVRQRARYIYEQLQLPPDQRVMRVPDLDAKQRMYKP